MKSTGLRNISFLIFLLQSYSINCQLVTDDLFSTFTPIYNYDISTSDEIGIFLSNDAIIDRYDCFSKCNFRKDCKMISYKGAQCKLYSQVKYSIILSSGLGPYLFEKYIEDYSSINSNLVNHWRFNDNPYDTVGAMDLYDGVNYAFVNDRLNRPKSAVYLNNGYFKMPTGIYFNGDFSVTIWAKVLTYSWWSRFFEVCNGTSKDRVIFAISRGSTGLVGIWINNNGVENGIKPSFQPKLNKWNHFAFTLRGSNGTVYLNGNIIGNAIMLQPRALIRTYNFFGRSQIVSNGWANGVFDDFMIFNKSLTQNELVKVMNNFY